MAVATTTRSRHPVLHGMVRTIRDHQLFEPGQHLLVAVSGGPDSVALLSLLTALAPAWHLTLTVVHFNYGLRGTNPTLTKPLLLRCVGNAEFLLSFNDRC